MDVNQLHAFMPFQYRAEGNGLSACNGFQTANCIVASLLVEERNRFSNKLFDGIHWSMVGVNLFGIFGFIWQLCEFEDCHRQNAYEFSNFGLFRLQRAVAQVVAVAVVDALKGNHMLNTQRYPYHREAEAAVVVEAVVVDAAAVDAEEAAVDAKFAFVTQ